MIKTIVMAFGLLASPALADISLKEATSGLTLVPCAQSSLSCVTLPLPYDHFGTDPAKTIDVTFALSFASQQSQGILFYYVGGPGSSGLQSADDTLSYFDASLTETMDIVFVDNRGIGAVRGLSCPVAQARMDTAHTMLDNPEAAKATARSYVESCTAEMDAGDFLAVVSTDQAVRDSEAFRQMIGAPKVWLYGLSYGTQLVQAYASQFPDAVKGVIIDGVVDLTLTPEQFYRSYILAAEDLLAETFAFCDQDAECRSDMGGEAAKVYDDLALRIAKAPAQVPFIQADGSETQRFLSQSMLEYNAFSALYSPDGRPEFLRTLAAAGRGDLGPMLLLGYSNLAINPETEQGTEDPGWFPAAYHAITCSDYGSGTGTPEDNANRILDEARAFAPQAPRLLRSYFMERLVCAYWPHQGPNTRPAQFAGGDWPTLVLNGDRDPITPISMAYAVADHARNAHAIYMQGGPHVIWGRGLSCPDTDVLALLTEGKRPKSREQLCKQDAVSDYSPLTLTDPEDLKDGFAVALAFDTEHYFFAPLAAWDGQEKASFGCPFGGTMTAEFTQSGTDYGFADCRFWPDLAATGHGQWIDMDGAEDGLSLNLAFLGKAKGQLIYRHLSASDTYSLTGVWNGQLAKLPR